MYQSHYAGKQTNATDLVPFAHVFEPQRFAGEGVYLVIAAVARAVGNVCRRIERSKAVRLTPASD